jgi:Haem-binding domain
MWWRLRFAGSISLHWIGRSFAIGLCAAFALAGCAGSGGNAPATPPPTDSLAADPQVGPLLVNSCFDCHSHEGSGTWKGELAPSYLFGEAKARKALDLSDWPAMSPEERRATANAIVSAVNDGSMPPGDYVSLRASAKLSDQQKQQLAAWASHFTAAPAH